MSQRKLVVSAVIFIFLTAIKMAAPALAADIRQVLRPAMDADFDYRAAFAGLGDRLSQAEAWAATRLGWGEAYPASGEFLVTTWKTKDRDGAVGLERPELPSGEESGEEAPPPMLVDEPVSGQGPEEETPAAVAAFLESQEAYADQALPVNVTYDYLPLTLDWTAPCTGNAPEGFGWRMHPILGELRFHYGTDIGAAEGSDIVSFAAGTVLATGEDPEGYGLYAIVGHADGWRTLYAHCSELLVPAGTWVEKGQVIAKVGMTGLATGPHLHFELTHEEVYYNPEYYLSAGAA